MLLHLCPIRRCWSAAQRRDTWITAKLGRATAGEVNRLKKSGHWVGAGRNSPYPHQVARGDRRHSQWGTAVKVRGLVRLGNAVARSLTRVAPLGMGPHHTARVVNNSNF